MTNKDKQTEMKITPEENSGQVESNSRSGENSQPQRRPWILYILALVGLIALIIIPVMLLQGNGSTSVNNGNEEFNFAEVVLTDLVQEEEYNGTIGSLEADPVLAQLSGTITDIPTPGETINQGEVLYTIDEQPVVLLHGELPAFQDLAIGEDTVPVNSQLAGVITWVPEPGTVIEQGQELFRVNDQPVILLYGDHPSFRTMYDYDPDFHSYKISYETYDNKPPTYDEGPNQIGNDVLQLEQALVALGYSHSAMRVDNEFTYATRYMVKQFQASVGATFDGILQLGEVVFLPGPAQVLEVHASPGDYSGGAVLSVSTGDPASGTLVLQLEEALEGLGFNANNSLEVDGVFSPETTQAVRDFQAAVGLEQDGMLNLGEVVFLPGDVRVTSQLATLGSTIAQGFPIIGISLVDKLVSINLPADQQDLLDVGDTVTIEMPDYTEVPGTVVFVSQTALAAANEWDPKTFEVRIEFKDPTVAEDLDEAPVDVIVVTDSIDDVMAIPVSALLALLEGGYAVEVHTGGNRTDLVAVEVGFFGSNNMIEIISGEIEPGDQVVVP